MKRLLKNELDITDESFVDAFEAQAPGFLKNENATCLPYSASLDSQRKIQAFSILSDEKRDKNTRLITLNKSPTTGTYLAQSQDLSTGFTGYQEIELALEDVVVNRTSKAMSAIPPELVWELSSLAKEIYAKNNPKDKRFVRVVFSAGDKNTWAQIVSVEILDSTRKIVLADGFWVHRDDVTGGFFTSSGTELEQDFWINPLNYTRISRGVGSFSAKGKRSQVVKKGNKSVVVTRFYTSYSSHQGIDYAAPTGTPIYAVANGKVVFYGVMSGYGNLVVLEHPGGYKTYYAHLSAFNPELGVDSDVRRGLEIGYVGSTGRSTGPHLHFELRKNGVYMNPMSEKLDIDLWSLRAADQQQLTRQIVLFSTLQQNAR
jgi:murein DD-endopeptidase MepM/ murein hydrolase activator NlpD